MPKVHFMPSGKSITVEEGTLLSDAARLLGLPIDASCGGMGKCGKCKMKIQTMSGEERDVLSCQFRVREDLTAYLFGEREMEVLSFGEKGEVPLSPNVTAKEGEDLLGLAVDVGTTTLAVSLVDLKVGDTLACETAMNPQVSFSGDVIGRIMAASEQGTETLKNILWDSLGEMTHTLLEKAGKKKEALKEAVVCANTVMQHLAMGISPESLGHFPYTPENLGDESLISPLCGKEMSEDATVYYPAVISGYVGSDIVAGLLASNVAETHKNVLFIVIGTNGEMVLSKDGKLYSTSTAAGPAFEGGNIRFGMRAAEGAIQKVNDDFTYEVIGGGEAVGICGSGLFDLTARLVEQKIIDESGFLDGSVEFEGESAFALTEKVYLLGKDVRQVQLAKGAIRAGVTALLSEVGLLTEEIEEVYIAGAFGYHLQEESLLSIGLLPKAFRGKITYVGNTALSGAEMMLKNAPLRKKITQKAREIKTVDLSLNENFNMLFAESMMFLEE